MSQTNLTSNDEEKIEEETEKLTSQENDDYELESSSVFSEEDNYEQENYVHEFYGEEEGEEEIGLDEESEKDDTFDEKNEPRHIKLQIQSDGPPPKEKTKIKLMMPSDEELKKSKKRSGKKLSSSSGSSSTEHDTDEQSDELVEEENEEEYMDREVYIDTYLKLMEEKKLLRRKNGFLHRKMSEHIRKRKLESLMKDPVNVDPNELQEKYEQKLLLLSDRMEWHASQKDKMSKELELLRKQVDEEQNLLDTTFQEFLKRQREVSIGLIDTSTGKPISDQLFNRLLHLQKQKLDTIGEIRLGCIRLRNKVANKEEILERIETLGDNLHLADYEQLRIDNQNYTNKNEERDEELSKLHNKSMAAIQILAHIRQKSYATTVDFQVMEGKLKAVETDLSETRENLNLLKMQRDSYRLEAIRLKESSGLLTQTKLLRDFENTNSEIIKAQIELEQIKKDFDIEKEELLRLQKLLEVCEEENKLRTSSTISRGKNSLIDNEHSKTVLKTLISGPHPI